MKNRFIVCLALSTMFVACVDVKDVKNIDQENLPTSPVSEVPQEVRELTQLIVDQPMYIFEGQFLTQNQYERKGRLPSLEKRLAFKFDYMKISKGAVLYTLGQNVLIQVKDLESEGRIETFPEGFTAPALTPGRDGGLIAISTENATGYMHSVLRGQNGGKGAAGKEPDENLRGETGEFVDGDCSEGGFLRWLGKKGKHGYDGGPGLRGGNTGSLNISVQNFDSWTFTYELIPGQGGEGGDGNPRGGPQGFEGKVAGCVFYDLYSGKNPLYVGDPGGIGPRGKNGSEEVLCITEKGSKTCPR